MVGERADGIGLERILTWMDRPSLTKARAAHATGASRRMLNYYLSGAKPIPKTVWLACLGWETVGPAGGDAVSLLQGQCPQGGSDVDWAQAVAGAGCRNGWPIQRAAVRCAGQPKRIGQVRTEQACAGAALHLAWALGSAQDGDRLGRCRCNSQPRHRPVCRRQLGVNTGALWVIIS